MSSVMKYKDYIGSVEFSEEDQIFYGKVLGIQTWVHYKNLVLYERKQNYEIQK